MDNIQTDELDQACLTTINKINFSQELKKVVAPMRYRKRLVKGLNEALKAVSLTLRDKWADSGELTRRSLKILIVAVDLKKIEEEHSPDFKLLRLVEQCRAKQIPVIFSCTRKELGFSLYGRKMKVTTKTSVIGIVNYEGFAKVE